ncbi:MAG: hypothetical protein JSV05_01950 [Candidatus Bathyarchaeota archaeon]|nr:MAG: hypothetical protein JSV05_01950 [Candidatus Bathyarchaeota archaeon]
MQPIDILMINEEAEKKEDLIKVIDEAGKYFPQKSWGAINYLGKLHLDHDVKIGTDGKSVGAFFFEKLIGKIKEATDRDSLVGLLLGITLDPVLVMHYSFDGKNFRRTGYFVHDYIAKKIGIVSFFRINKLSYAKIVAHGLGHNKGLNHHTYPIDLMYVELPKEPRLQVEGFCNFCLRKLKMID